MGTKSSGKDKNTQAKGEILIIRYYKLLKDFFCHLSFVRNDSLEPPYLLPCLKILLNGKIKNSKTKLTEKPVWTSR